MALLRRVFEEQYEVVAGQGIEHRKDMASDRVQNPHDPEAQYVDGAYISGERLVQAEAQGIRLVGPAAHSPSNNKGRFTAESFEVEVEQRRAVCPAGKENTQCSRLEEAQSGKVSYRFEWSYHCHECPLREQCVGTGQKHRTLVVGEHYTALQSRRA